MISTESQLLNEIFRLTLKIFLFLGLSRLAFSCKPFTYGRDHLLWSNKIVYILLNSKKCTYLKVQNIKYLEVSDMNDILNTENSAILPKRVYGAVT